jgi:hypothetical protein
MRSDRSALVVGSWDIHVHAGPSLFPRWGDAWDLAQACEKARMAGFVLKSHRASTVESAAILRRAFGGLHIFGGVALNHFVGGLNTLVVDACIRLGGKVVWLPTIHAEHHRDTCGCLGGFSFQSSAARVTPRRGIRVIDARRRLLPTMREILGLLHDSGVVLATGHLSSSEIAAIHACIRTERLRIPLLINHVLFKTTLLSQRQVAELANSSTWFEIAHLSITPLARSTSAERIASYIRRTPQAQWVMASDSGQKGNVAAPEALARFAKNLASSGVERDTLRRIMHSNPERLLGLR